jgi:hypothetical protein
MNPSVETALTEEIAVGIGSGSEAARHRYAGTGQVADHFAQRSIFTAYALDVAHPQMLKPDNIFGQGSISKVVQEKLQCRLC